MEPGGHGPIRIEVYKEFAGDFLGMSDRAQEEFNYFANFIQARENPYAPELQSRCTIHENELIEYPLGEGVIVLWKVRSQTFGIFPSQIYVVILSIERRT